MAEEIRRIITVDTKNSDKSIRDLKNEIKGLQKELEQTAVGSDEFNSALKRLTQTQKSYNEIQQQVRSMSKTNQQNMVNMASFARNLGKAYSSLNAAIGLFANGNEDVQKAMLKVQRSIQVIQGLDGIVGIIRDLPNVARGFRNWLSSLSPIERSVNNIARQINGINPSKINAINRGGGSAAAAAAAGGGGGGGTGPVNIQTQALAEQTRVVTALNKAQEEAVNREKSLRSEMEKTYDEAEKLIFGGETALKLADRLQEKIFTVDRELNEMVKGFDSLDEAMQDPKVKAKADELANLNSQMAALKKGGDEAAKAVKELNAKYDDLSVEAEKASKSVKEFEGATKSGTAAVGSFMKSVASTVWWTVLISFLVTAVYKLFDYITNLKNAATEQRKLNKAIAEGTSQIASKQIVILKELALGYERVGDSAEAKAKFIKDYADKIKETGIAVTDVNKADDVFINNTSKYIDALMKRAKAQATENQAIKLYEEYLNKRYDLEEKYDKKRSRKPDMSKEDYIAILMATGSTQEQAEEAWATAITGRQEKVQEKIEDLDKWIENRLKKLFKDIADAEEEYGGILGGGGSTASASADAGTKELEDTIKQDLEALIQYYKEAEQVLSDEMVNAKQAIMDKYAERIALAEKYGRDTVELELAREKELADLEKQFAENQANEEYQRIQTHIEQIRRMYDTSNLREPTEQRYQTKYQQPPITRALGLVGLATGTDWINVYQSKEDVEKQFEEQIKYNNQFYELTKQRIDKENELLNQQLKTEQDWLKQRLEIEGLTEIERDEIKEESADRQLEIQRTLTENMIALSDAQLQNEQANLQAYLDAQEKRRQALNGVLDVTSTLTGALASMFRMQAEEAEEGSKKQKAATAAYKAFAITQAIADTYKGANEAYTAMASIPYVGPVLGAIAAGAAIVSGIANVMSIKREEISTSTATSSQASVSAPSALNTPPIEYTRNLIGDKELDEMNSGIRCYVLESDITSTQNKVKVTEQNASF